MIDSVLYKIMGFLASGQTGISLSWSNIERKKDDWRRTFQTGRKRAEGNCPFAPMVDWWGLMDFSDWGTTLIFPCYLLFCSRRDERIIDVSWQGKWWGRFWNWTKKRGFWFVVWLWFLISIKLIKWNFDNFLEFLYNKKYIQSIFTPFPIINSFKTSLLQNKNINHRRFKHRLRYKSQ